MRKGLLGIFVGLVILVGCNQAETEVVESTEIKDIEDIEIFAGSDRPMNPLLKRK